MPRDKLFSQVSQIYRLTRNGRSFEDNFRIRGRHKI